MSTIFDNDVVQLGRAALAADQIAYALQSHGVDRIFLMTGGDFALWRALEDAGIKMILARSEAGSVVMADAYARLTGRPAVVYGQWGPGAANVAGALADAHWAGSPLVALTTTVPTTSQYRFEYQELDQEPMFASVTKWQARVPRADRAGELMVQALRIAGSAPCGPVHLDIPTDVARTPLGGDTITRPVRGPVVHRPAPSGSAVAGLVDILGSASRPLILAGGGVLASEGAPSLVELAEAIDVPVATSMGGKGSIPENHPLSVGVAGRYSRRVANEVLAEADVVLAIGTDLGGLASDTYRLPADGCRIAQIDIDESRIGRTREVEMGIVADAGEALRALAGALVQNQLGVDTGWKVSIRQRVGAWEDRLRSISVKPAAGHVRPEAVVAILREIAADDDVVVADTGFIGAWAGALFPVHVTGRTFIRAAGTLGWAYPAVLGAQMANPDRRSFALVGDGGMGYNIGDIETAVRLAVPTVTIVLNNSCLAYEHVAFDKRFNGRIVHEVCDFEVLDFGAIAESIGAFGAHADSADQLRESLAAAVAQDRPAFIDVTVDKNRFAPVTSFDKATSRDL